MSEQPNLTPAEIAQMREAVAEALRPATATWFGKRITALLNHYYIADMDDDARELQANDWLDAFTIEGECPPAWAIHNACLKWLASEHARKKPLPGDILALARAEMEWAYMLKSRLFYEDRPHMRHLHKRAHYLWPDKLIPEDERKRVLAKIAALNLRLGNAAA